MKKYTTLFLLLAGYTLFLIFVYGMCAITLLSWAVNLSDIPAVVRLLLGVGVSLVTAIAVGGAVSVVSHK